MALFESGNPTLSEKIFNRSLNPADTEVMTVKGSIQKFGFLLLMVAAGAAYNWKMYSEFKFPTMNTLMIVGFIGGLISALIISFKPTTARWLSPAYGLLEGLALGGLSAVINDAFKTKYPGIVLQAVMLTFAVAFAMFLLYNFRIIKPTRKFKSILIGAIVGISLFYLVWMLLRLFGVNLGFMAWGNSSPLGIGISLVIVAVAAFSLILDFERIEVGAEMGAPKYMEWYGAFGLLVTMVWLYVEILKLLSRFANNRN
jgi:uncharacterized YccA/Bax inhibitor family protein